MLSIDGGGIRGVLALGILQKIEDILKAKSGSDDFRLADYFDYIAGTSTGGIIAAGLSIGMPVKDIMAFYLKNGTQMFEKVGLLKRLRYKFESEPLAKQLKTVFGADTQFGSDRLRTLLLLVLRNATTDSPWPLSNNPYAKYNDDTYADPNRPDNNLRLPLWQLVRASTAAPTYFPPEVIVLRDKNNKPIRQFVFVDGGITMYNDPAFQMFLMATLDRYWVRKPQARWTSGENNLLIVSIGTGTSPDARAGLTPDDMNLLFDATTIPSALMFAALNEQDLLCRVFGKCLSGGPLDREVGDLIGSEGPLAVGQKLFTYVRYNAELTRGGLDALGCKDIDPSLVQQMDSVDGIPALQMVGGRVAEKNVSEEHFAAFPPA
ncbi:patatin [Mesorhizobium erdmanii]|uniref:Patatin n=3 Tax=Phyllobacteriaceae TaxID=69277 RepID=A0A3M9X374_9HYPH|nr:patatin [Mesorhizobium japonicum]RXT47918.1 patatin [Mesorhizobium erdmanii]